MTMSKYDEGKRKRRREGANEREKTRNIELNKAYDSLIKKMDPYIPQHADLPKIKRLRLAIEYIKFLEDCLKNGEEKEPESEPKRLEEFTKTALVEIQARNSYSDRLHEATFERPRKASSVGKSPDSNQSPISLQWTNEIPLTKETFDQTQGKVQNLDAFHRFCPRSNPSSTSSLDFLPHQDSRIDLPAFSLDFPFPSEAQFDRCSNVEMKALTLPLPPLSLDNHFGF
ncbi:unnamed protein product, partial [Mesorhabditis belari]|uniref:BHLH domain-containing protein n=1 Tax=Mesorhabditis belari TaxID=2138241 RepID=A0AAF3EFP1_9BILA